DTQAEEAQPGTRAALGSRGRSGSGIAVVRRGLIRHAAPTAAADSCAAAATTHPATAPRGRSEGAGVLAEASVARVARADGVLTTPMSAAPTDRDDNKHREKPAADVRRAHREPPNSRSRHAS